MAVNVTSEWEEDEEGLVEEICLSPAAYYNSPEADAAVLEEVRSAAAKAEAARVVNIGIGLAKKPQGCRPGDTNTGLLCTQPINTKCEPITWDGCCSRGLFNECYGCARGGQCNTTGGGTYTQDLKCDAGKDEIDGLCYNPCPAGKKHIAGAPWNCKA
jgi:hypothetical protein